MPKAPGASAPCLKRPPSRRDVLDAIQHADTYGDKGWMPDDFTLTFVGCLTVKQLERYESLDWLDQIDTADELPSFRGEAWAVMARRWTTEGIPPILLITAPDDDNVPYTQVGDGRGRVLFAALMKMKLPVWHLRLKRPA